LLLVVYEAEEPQGGCVESFPLDETEEDHPRPLAQARATEMVRQLHRELENPYNCWQWALLPL